MKTRKRLKYTKNTRKKTRKTQYAGMYCYLNDNIQELSPIYLEGNDNGVITKGEKGQVINLNCCWMNSALYAFLAHDQVYNILEQRDHTSFELQKNEDRDDHSLYELAIMVKEFRDLGDAPPYTAVRWDAWSYHELYKLIKEKYNFMPEDFPRFGDFGDARTIFELFLNLFERRSKSKQNIEKVKIGWEKLIGNHGYVNSLQELCDFLNQNEGYTCVSFTKTWRCITEVQTVSEDEEFDAFHFVTYARINKNKWRFFDSGNTVKDVSLEQTILPFCPKGKAYYISGLFVKNNSLQEDNKGKQEEDNKGKQEEDNKGKQEEDEELQRALALSLTENQNESEEMRLARLAAEDNALQLGDEDDLATVKSDDDKDADWSSDNQSSSSSSSSSSSPTQDVVPQVNQTSEEDNGDNEFEEAEILYMTGKYEEALPLLREALIKYMLLQGNISHNPPVLDKDIQFIEENLKNVDTELKRRKEEIMKEQIAIDKENAEAEELRLVQEKEKAQADLDAKNKELELAKKKSDEERTISEEFENLRIQEEKEKERIQNEQAEAERKAIEKQQELEAKAEENKNMLLLAQQAEQKRIQDEQAEAERKAIEKQKELEAKAEENKNMLLLAQQAEQKRIQDEEAETKRKAIEKQNEIKRRKQKIENAKNDYRSDMDVRLKNMLKYNEEELIPASKKIVKENARFYKIWEIYWEDKEKFGTEDSMNKVMKSLIKLIVEHPEEYEAIEYIKRYIKRREFELKETDENDPQHKILLGVIEYLRGVLQKSLKRKQELERGENKIGDEIEKTYNQLQDPKLQNNREQEATESLIKSIEKKNNSKLEESNQRKTQKKKLLRLQSQIKDIKPKQNILQKKIIDPVKQIKTLKLVLNKPTTEKSTENEPSERWIKRNGQWVRGIETSEEKYLREKQEERKQKEKEIQRIELQKGHEIEMKEQLEHERLYKEGEAKKAAEKEENKREVIRNRKLKHPTFINLASNELEEGEEIIYHRSDGKTVMAVIKKIHKDDRVPYYTIQFQDGTERQTVRDKIEKIM